MAVRRLVGYDRYTTRAAHGQAQEVYEPLRLQLNFFRPIRKLVAKQRVGAKVRKRYDTAQTPYQRVLASGALAQDARLALKQQFEALNPAELTRRIDQALRALWRLAQDESRASSEARVR